MNIIRVNAKDRFMNKLKGVSDPEQKRKIIGNEFVYVFDDEASKLKGVDFLAQGTLYTDVINQVPRQHKQSNHITVSSSTRRHGIRINRTNQYIV